MAQLQAAQQAQGEANGGADGADGESRPTPETDAALIPRSGDEPAR